MSQSKYDQHTEANIATLQADFADRVRQWLAEARRQGLNPLIHFGARSIDKQRQLHEDFINHRGPRAVAPERSYHCYGRAFDWVNIADPNGGDDGLGWDDNAAYAKGTKVGSAFQIAGIGSDDNDHLQDSHFPTFADLSKSEFGSFPTASLA
jgi:hypothetical protein